MNEQQKRLSLLIDVGNLMANLCYNGAQAGGVPENLRVSMRQLQKEWDAKKRAWRERAKEDR